MNFYEGLNFFLCLIIAVIPAMLLGITEKSLCFYRFGMSVLFLYMVFRSDMIQLTYMIVFVIWSLGVVKLYLFLRKKLKRNKTVYFFAVVAALLPLVVNKITNLFEYNIWGFLGISYITFKIVQIIIEIYDGIIKEVRVFECLNFILFFPSFSAGPIDRSRRFEGDYNKVYARSEYLELAGTGIQKILFGAVYKFVLSAIAYDWLQNVFADRYHPVFVIGYAYCYGIYMFFDFAGYSMMAIGVSYIFGIRTPDNFKLPFISVDITDFWNRWHITLSQWFRDFIFSRFMMQSIRKKWFKNRVIGASTGLLINMFIMGIWHGVNSYYILYGIYHGILLAINEVYQKKSGFYANNKEKKWYKMLSWFLTINLVMLGFLIFSGHANDVFWTYLAKLAK